MSIKTALIFSLAATSLAAPTPQFTQFQSSRGDVVAGVCRPYTIIFARGTMELGNMGSTVGPSLSAAIEELVGAGQLATQGVDYAADASGNFFGSVDPKDVPGAKTMAKLTKQVKTACPTTKVILGGYSQGALQVRGALMNLDAGDVAAAVTFGDPLSSRSFEHISNGKAKVWCNVGDGVCLDTFFISAAHLSYGIDGSVTSAAKFAVNAANTA